MTFYVDVEHDDLVVRFTEVHGATATENRHHGFVRYYFLLATVLGDPRIPALFEQLDRVAGVAVADIRDRMMTALAALAPLLWLEGWPAMRSLVTDDPKRAGSLLAHAREAAAGHAADQALLDEPWRLRDEALTKVRDLDNRLAAREVVPFVFDAMLKTDAWKNRPHVEGFAMDLIDAWSLDRQAQLGAHMPEHRRIEVFAGPGPGDWPRVLPSDPMALKWWENPLDVPRLPPGPRPRSDTTRALVRAAAWLYRTRVKSPPDSISAIAREAYGNLRDDPPAGELRRAHVRRDITRAERLLALAN